MGQRINYIVKSDSEMDIYYSNHRANLVTSDLLQGSQNFINFIRHLNKVDRLMSMTWMDSCVFMDIDCKVLLFWDDELLWLSSIRQYCLNYIQAIWKGWKIVYAERMMYDIERKINIDYLSNQKKDFNNITDYCLKEHLEQLKLPDEVLDEELLLDVGCMVIIKKKNVYKKNIYASDGEGILLLGEQVIPVLEKKHTTPLVRECFLDISDIVVIDYDNKHLLINKITYGLEEKIQPLWKDWVIENANYGYIKILEKVGIDASEIKMTDEEIDKEIQYIPSLQGKFPPVGGSLPSTGK